MQADSGYHRWWPHGRGIYLNDSKTFAVWLNEGDHIRVISIQQGGDSRSVFATLVKAVNTIEKLLQELDGRTFQKTDRLGMITCCPTNLGTGLRGGVLIQLQKRSQRMGKRKPLASPWSLWRAFRLFWRHLWHLQQIPAWLLRGTAGAICDWRCEQVDQNGRIGLRRTAVCCAN